MWGCGLEHPAFGLTCLSAKEVEEFADSLNAIGLKTSTDWKKGQRVLDAYRELIKMAKKNQQQKPRKLSSPEGEQAYTTDISDADSSAKVLKNLETLAEKLEKVSNERKNFLSEVGDSTRTLAMVMLCS